MFLDKVLDQPIIGAIGTSDDVQTLIPTSCEVFFILNGEIGALREMVEPLTEAGKLVFVHVDLINGLKGDGAGLKFLKEVVKPTGIISTKGSLIKEAKAIGLFAIQRLFLLDSKNLETGLTSITKCQPDAIELLPGALHKVTTIIANKTHTPVISGGLIMDKEDIILSLKAGAVGVSTSNRSLWSV